MKWGCAEICSDAGAAKDGNGWVHEGGRCDRWKEGRNEVWELVLYMLSNKMSCDAKPKSTPFLKNFI
jgi:hypothetical protein